MERVVMTGPEGKGEEGALGENELAKQPCAAS